MRIAIVNDSLEITSPFSRMDSVPTDRLTSLLPGRAVIDSPSRNGCAQISIPPQTNKIPRDDINSALSGTLSNQNGHFVSTLIIAAMSDNGIGELFTLERDFPDAAFTITNALEDPTKPNATELQIISGFLNEPIASEHTTKVQVPLEKTAHKQQPAQEFQFHPDDQLIILLLETLEILSEFPNAETCEAIQVSKLLFPTRLSSVEIANNKYRNEIVKQGLRVKNRSSHRESIELVSQIAANSSLVTDENRDELVDLILNSGTSTMPFLISLLKNPRILTESNFDLITTSIIKNDDVTASSVLANNPTLYTFGERSQKLINWATRNKEDFRLASSIHSYLYCKDYPADKIDSPENTNDDDVVDVVDILLIDPELNIDKPEGVTDADLTIESDDESSTTTLDIDGFLDELMTGRLMAGRLYEGREITFLPHFFPSELTSYEKNNLIRRLTDPRMKNSYLAKRLAHPVYELIPKGQIPIRLAEWAIQNQDHVFASTLFWRKDFPRHVNRDPALIESSLVENHDRTPTTDKRSVKTLGDQAIELIVPLKTTEDLKTTKLSDIILAYRVKQILPIIYKEDTDKALIAFGQNPIFSKHSDVMIESLVENAIANPLDPFNIGLGLNFLFLNVVPYKLKMKIINSFLNNPTGNGFSANAIKKLHNIEPHTKSDIEKAKLDILLDLYRSTITDGPKNSSENVSSDIDCFEVSSNPEDITEYHFIESDKNKHLKRFQTSTRSEFLYIFYAAQMPDLITKKNLVTTIDFCKSNPNHNFAIGFALNPALDDENIFSPSEMSELMQWAAKQNIAENGFANSLMNRTHKPDLNKLRVKTTMRDKANALFEESKSRGKYYRETNRFITHLKDAITLRQQSA